VAIKVLRTIYFATVMLLVSAIQAYEMVATARRETVAGTQLTEEAVFFLNVIQVLDLFCFYL